PLSEDHPAAGWWSRPPAAPRRSVGCPPAVVYRGVLTSGREAASCRRCRSHRTPHRASVRHGTRHRGTLPPHYTAHPAPSLQTSACSLPASAPCAMARDADHTATRRFTLERVTPRRAEVQGHREMRGAGIPHVRGEEASVPPCQPCYCRTA